MLQSKLFYKARKEAPKEAFAISHKLLLRAGFISPLSSGIYSLLPLGWRVMTKLESIIRQEMNAIGGQEVFLPALHPREIWQKTGRWEEMDDLYKLKDDSGRYFALGPTHEEVITPLVKKFVQTYRDLPLYLYQIQNKFRQETRAKSGLLRGREFIMKDLYSFHQTEEDLDKYYEEVKKAYWRIFKRVGLAGKTYLTFASGGSFSRYSHEFQTLTGAGEDLIYICQNCNQAINKEIKAKTPKCPNCGNSKFKNFKAIEVGNIFKLKTKFSKAFDLYYVGKNGQKKLVIMGCYGIGIGRLMAAIVEINNDERGIVWPKETAPFLFHLIRIGNRKEIVEKGNLIYHNLKEKENLLYDEREDKSAGEKFAESDLLGIPFRIVLSEKTLKSNSVEIKGRQEKKSHYLKIKDLKNFLKENSKINLKK